MLPLYNHICPIFLSNSSICTWLKLTFQYNKRIPFVGGNTVLNIPTPDSFGPRLVHFQMLLLHNHIQFLFPIPQFADRCAGLTKEFSFSVGGNAQVLRIPTPHLTSRVGNAA